MLRVFFDCYTVHVYSFYVNFIYTCYTLFRDLLVKIWFLKTFFVQFKSVGQMDKYVPSPNCLPDHSPIRTKVCEIISQAWGLKNVIDFNPCVIPTVLESSFFFKHIETSPTDYMVSEILEGHRFLLVLGTCDRKGFCVMVNKHMQLYEVPILANSDYFRGSVFDGLLTTETLSSGQERQKYLIFDTISIKGETRKNDPFLKRYNEYFGVFDLEGKDILDMDSSKWESLAYEWTETKAKIVCLGNKFALQFYPKPFVQFLNMGSLWRTMSRGNHQHTHGIVFVKSTSVVGMGTDTNVIKWKQHHTMNLIIHSTYIKGKWTFKLCFYDQGKKLESLDKPFAIHRQSITSDLPMIRNTSIPNKPTSEHEQSQVYLQLKENTIIESTCRYFAELHKTSFALIGKCLCTIDPDQPIAWCEVLKWQNVVKTPDTFDLIQKTLNNILNNVSVSDLLRSSTKTMYQT